MRTLNPPRRGRSCVLVSPLYQGTPFNTTIVLPSYLRPIRLLSKDKVVGYPEESIYLVPYSLPIHSLLQSPMSLDSQFLTVLSQGTSLTKITPCPVLKVPSHGTETWASGE